MPPLSFNRVPSASLSLWQSAVAQFASTQLQQTSSTVSQTHVMQHPMVSAAAEHVQATFHRNPPTEPDALGETHATYVYISHVCYEQAKAEHNGDVARAAYFATQYRKFSDKDPGFASCATTWAKYKLEYSGKYLYNDWTVQGAGNINYGVIEWQLPANAKVAIVGDWGTGLDDAILLMANILTQFKPDAIIHLGDIYYSGTPDECSEYFLLALEKAGVGDTPVFTIPGNHDYYALGYGFYPMLKQLNTKVAGASQDASYFCLRTEDGGYQFLAMDTGYNDADPGDQINADYAGPWLQPTEIQWHQDKLKNFGGATILLSHHQLYSTNAKLNGEVSQYAELPYLNPYLYQAFWPWLQTKVAAWVWGHEHNFALYQSNLLQLQQGVLLGCSAYEELTSANPYTQNYPQIPYNKNAGNWMLGTNTDPNGVGYYNHAFAIFDFSKRTDPSDFVVVSYYQYPSWGDTPPPNPKLSMLTRAGYSMPSPLPAKPVQYGDVMTLFCQEGLFISPFYQDTYANYPTATTNSPVGLVITGSKGTINHGDVVKICTTEKAGSGNELGAWSTATLYYYSGSYKQLNWTVYKKDTSNGKQINYGDAIYFVNNDHKQWLTIYWSRVYGDIYLTTRKDANYYWQILPKLPGI